MEAELFSSVQKFVASFSRIRQLLPGVLRVQHDMPRRPLLEEKNNACCSGMKEIVDALRDKSFLKPFSILVFLHCIGFEWIGLAFIAYYMVGILIEAEIPFDPYLACAGIALFRFSLMIIFAFAIANHIA